MRYHCTFIGNLGKTGKLTGCCRCWEESIGLSILPSRGCSIVGRGFVGGLFEGGFGIEGTFCEGIIIIIDYFNGDYYFIIIFVSVVKMSLAGDWWKLFRGKIFYCLHFLLRSCFGG